MSSESPTAPPVEPEDDLKLAVIGKRSMASLIPVNESGLQPKNFEDLLRLAKHVIASGAAPKGMTTEGAVVLAMQAGLERGMGPLAGLSGFVVINGVLSARGWLAKALLQQSPVVVKGSLFSGIEGDGMERRGWAEAQRVGYAKPFRRTFSRQDAMTAGLLKKEGPWQTAPDNMLEWRAIGYLARMDFGDVLGGIPLSEEAQDFVEIDHGKTSASPRREPPVVTKPDNLIEKLKAQATGTTPAEPVEVKQAREAVVASPAVIDVTPVVAAEEEPTPLALFPPTPATGCDHGPARAYLKKHHKKTGTVVVCEACTLEVKLQEDGSLALV